MDGSNAHDVCVTFVDLHRRHLSKVRPVHTPDPADRIRSLRCKLQILYVRRTWTTQNDSLIEAIHEPNREKCTSGIKSYMFRSCVSLAERNANNKYLNLQVEVCLQLVSRALGEVTRS